MVSVEGNYHNIGYQLVIKFTKIFIINHYPLCHILNLRKLLESLSS